jgi:hypothetical protein
MGFEFRFQLEIEDLELSGSFESDDFGGRMHDGTIGSDGTTHDGTVVMQVDDNHLIRFVDFLADTTRNKSDENQNKKIRDIPNEMITLHCQSAESNGTWLNT